MPHPKAAVFIASFATSVLLSAWSMTVPGEARAGKRIPVDRLVIDDKPQRGLEYKYHWAGGDDDNFCFEGGVNCAIVVFDPDPVTPGDEETVGFVYSR